MESTQIYYDLLKQKEILENDMIDLGLHAKGISEHLISLEVEGANNIAQWFHIANGIKGLKYDGITYDDSYYWCTPAYDYETDRQELYQRLVKEITLFSYLYSGIEAIISSYELSPCPYKKGKIQTATYYLKAKLSEWTLPVPFYDRTVNLCEKMFQVTFDKNYKLVNELSDCVSIHGLGLRLIYKIRNKIMHGDFFFPEPLDHNSIPPLQPEIISLCNRLLLMTCQMLQLSFWKDELEPNFQLYNSSIIKRKNRSGISIVNEKTYLSHFHTHQTDFRAEQLELSLK